MSNDPYFMQYVDVPTYTLKASERVVNTPSVLSWEYGYPLHIRAYPQSVRITPVCRCPDPCKIHGDCAEPYSST